MSRYKFADLLRSGCSTSFVGLFEEVVKVAELLPAVSLTVTRGDSSSSLALWWSWLLLLDCWFKKC